ncbi:export membrane protein SecD [Mobiluncus holmesii ATCC 35242]|uniref:Protein translocase subunit SecD n=1 Tax=Mobiluncus holmesii ATCC 35242 TaxID=887899 RepID=E6M2P6_9ACTO|nr:protein translocase subunit SecD [Mobiluncus holmesii]EFU82232.1 export membrane protein SecD [Mobiluncus holmesii ATCC 35242]STY88794.1 preprotein translocase subunit SecD [Mobiluncus holmesii]
MAAKKTKNKALRTLIFFAVIVVALAGTLVGSTIFSNGSYAPKLAIDLEGGTQLILTPKNTEAKAKAISDADIEQAIEVIRQRIDASGVAEAEIARNGQENISVGIPGNPSEETLALIQQSAVMRFRTVLLSAPGNATNNEDPQALLGQLTGAAAPAGQGQPAAGETGGQQTQTTVGEGNNTVTIPPSAPTEKGKTQSLVLNSTDPSATPEPTSNPGKPAPTPAAKQHPSAAIPFDELMKQAEKYPDTPAGESKVINDRKHITVRDMFIFNHLDCTDPASLKGGSLDDPKKNLVACSKEGYEKYILGPEVLSGTDLVSASSGMGTNQQGNATGQWEVALKLDADGAKKFDAVAKVLYPNQNQGSNRNPDNNRFAIVLDSLVVSAPGVNAPAFGGSASISGSLTRESSATLANQLQFGSLPLNFEQQSKQSISATLGGEHLKVGFYAAIVGLILVVLYLLQQYHALAGLATASLLLAGGIVYLAVAILSWSMGYRLSLAGVVGLIVAVGVTMDSFIIYFERIRDEVRDGKPLATAVETGWNRAKRTIVVSDIVNIVAAVVLYVLAVGGVQGFAFTLGLTTLVDLGIIFLFTHPMMSLLIKTRYFGEGRKFSGLDPLHLGASSDRIYMRSTATATFSRKKKSAQKVASPTISLARQKAGLLQADEEDTADTAATQNANLESDTPATEPAAETSSTESQSETAKSDESGEDTASKDEPTQTEEDAK